MPTASELLARTMKARGIETIFHITGAPNIQLTRECEKLGIALVGVRTITAQLQSEVTRNSDDVEVSVSLDVTGSMAGSKISSLITATNSLIDLVVNDSQVPSYSKMAIVPWSFGANLGATTAAAAPRTTTAASTRRAGSRCAEAPSTSH